MESSFVVVQHFNDRKEETFLGSAEEALERAKMFRDYPKPGLEEVEVFHDVRVSLGQWAVG